MNSPCIMQNRPRAGDVFRTRRTAVGREEGFSLLEMAVVISVLLIIATIALLAAENVIHSVHLQQSAVAYANLLQQARVRAVQDDTYYSVVASTSTSVCPSSGSLTACAFIDIAGTGVYASGDPLMEFPADTKPKPFNSGPSASALEAVFLPAGSSGTVNTTATGPTFGPRGLPCSPTTSGGYTTCPFLTPTSYITFMKNGWTNNWEAVTVTPAGRIREWSYDGTNWNPLN